MAAPRAKLQKTKVSPETIMVKVCGFDGSCWEIECDEACTVHQAKAALEVRASVPKAEQVLLAGERELRGDDVVQDLLSSGATLTLLRRKHLWDSELQDGQTPGTILEYSDVGERGIVRFDEKYELTTRRVTAIDSGVFSSIVGIQLFKNWFSDDNAFKVFCRIICTDICGPHLRVFTMSDCWLATGHVQQLLQALLSCPALKTLDIGLEGGVLQILKPLELLVTSAPKLHEVIVNGDDCKNVLTGIAAEELSRRAPEAHESDNDSDDD